MCWLNKPYKGLSYYSAAASSITELSHTLPLSISPDCTTSYRMMGLAWADAEADAVMTKTGHAILA